MAWDKWRYLESIFPKLKHDRTELNLALLRAERSFPRKARQYAVFRQHYRLYPGEDPDAIMPFSKVAPIFGISIGRASQMCRDVEGLLRGDSEFWSED